MSDIVDRKTRSEMMSGIRATDTKPELTIRAALFRKGFRYRLHYKGLPGKPDLVFPRYRAVIFVDGCFWHMHECDLFKWPKTRKEFWQTKLTRNRDRDAEVEEKLQLTDWRVLRIRECALKGRKRRTVEEITEMTGSWLVGNSKYLEISGK
jgi:DNA mismatch endonuclease (patch repair protein)